ncbi:MAG: CRTAC1 family protein [Colwellia sp.]|nr:CRTAC1 family protein [Colwellia sp.]
MKNLTLVTVFSVFLLNCGGDSPTQPLPDTQEPDKGPISGVPVKVTYSDPIGSDTHQCHSTSATTENIMFSEISEMSGLNYSHSMPNGDGALGQSGGVSAGDFDGDGWVDLYVIGGEGRPNLLLKNNGDGTFIDIAGYADVAVQNKGSGPSFADINGDGLLDLFVGSVGGDSPRLFLNQGNEQFLDITASSGLELPGNNFSAAWGDYDKDNDLDLVITHRSTVSKQYYAYLWRNNGDLTFTDISLKADISMLSPLDNTFTPNFADINNDGWQDLLMVSDNNQTRLYLNDKDGTFTDITNEDVFTDIAGMGSAIGDYDNDGDLDWFVTAVSSDENADYFPGSTLTGNRFYQNNGSEGFVDKTKETGVYFGGWGWATCFSDFNNDGRLDLFLVNGMEGDGIDPIYKNDPSMLYIGDRHGKFKESAVALGINDTGMGRGIVCFDYDKDGDQDIYIANYNQPPKLYCNHGNSNNFVNIKLVELSGNTQAVGARIFVRTDFDTQMRELRSSNNYVSQNPVEAHFGLKDAEAIELVTIVWPDGEVSQITNININQFVIIERQ